MNELVQAFSDFKPEAIRWLWPGNLSFGSLALLDGDPGLGKSLVALDLCARLTTGRPFPGSDAAPAQAPAMVFNAEDGSASSVLPRLVALGADLSRTHGLRRDFQGKHGDFRLPAHTRPLEEALADTGARLVVIDPVTAFLDESVNLASEMTIRHTLLPLAEIAARHDCVFLLIRHLNKMLGTCSIYRGTGSIAFQGVCRSSWLFGRDPVDTERCVMAQVKNNYAPLQPALSYAVKAQGDTVTLEWLGASKLSANQLLAAAGRKPDLPGPRERAREFIVAFLRDGPRPTTEIWPTAQKLGFSRSTLRLARKAEKIATVRTWTDNTRLNYWLLPGQKLPGEAADDGDDLQDLLEPLIKQYPVTPIDGP
jgi:hypothetical protein